MRNTIFSFLLIFIGLSSVRAQSVTGKVIDQQGNAIEFANVVLLSKADSVALTGTITGSTGAFSLQSSAAMANTCLRLSFVGYKPQTLCEVQPDMGSNKPPLDGAGEQHHLPALGHEAQRQSDLSGQRQHAKYHDKKYDFCRYLAVEIFPQKAATPERGHRRHPPRTKRVLGAQHGRPQNNKECKARFAPSVCEP